MSLRSTLYPKTPSGRAVAFVHRADGTGGLGEIDSYTPTEEGSLLRRRRVEMGLSLRELASRLSLTPAEVAALECGRAGTSDWDAVFAGLRGTP